jgi:hypothetical protein
MIGLYKQGGHVLHQRAASADPDGHTVRFFDTDYPPPVSTYMGSEIDPYAAGHQIARPMIQVLPDHREDCSTCHKAELEGELIIVE